MKKRAFKLAFLGIALLMVVPILSHASSSAQDGSLNETHLEKIRQNCVAAQGSMQRVRHSDVATRINFGRAYDSLLTQLITPLNTRAVTDQSSSAPRLTEQTTELTMKVEEFRGHYAEYIDALNRAITLNCQDRPADFYAALQTAHDFRDRLAGDVRALKQISANYQETVQEALAAFPQRPEANEEDR